MKCSRTPGELFGGAAGQWLDSGACRLGGPSGRGQSDHSAHGCRWLAREVTVRLDYPYPAEEDLIVALVTEILSV